MKGPSPPRGRAATWHSGLHKAVTDGHKASEAVLEPTDHAFDFLYCGTPPKVGRWRW